MRWEEETLESGLVKVLRSQAVNRMLSIEGMAELGARLLELSEDPPVIVLVLDIVHAELEPVHEVAAGSRPAEDFLPVPTAIRGTERYPLPVIAAIPRQATAGGCELALGCDMRFVAPAARLGLYECSMGIIPGAGGTQRLPRLVGPGQAARLVFSGQTISGNEALEVGLAEVVSDDPERAAVAYAATVAANGQGVLRAAKTALRAARERPLREGLLIEGEEFVKVTQQPLANERLRGWERPDSSAGA